MATLATVTIKMVDAEGKAVSRSYQARDNEPSDVEVQLLAERLQALTAWSVIGATVTRDVDVSAYTDAAEAGSSRQRDASLVYNPTSTLRNSLGGKYTFRMPQFKAALLDSNGRISDTGAADIDNWTELFDDGAGIAAIVGTYFAGNQQELVEEVEPTEGFQNKD